MNMHTLGTALTILGWLWAGAFLAAASVVIGSLIGERWDKRHPVLSDVDREWLTANGVSVQ